MLRFLIAGMVFLNLLAVGAGSCFAEDCPSGYPAWVNVFSPNNSRLTTGEQDAGTWGDGGDVFWSDGASVVLIPNDSGPLLSATSLPTQLKISTSPMPGRITIYDAEGDFSQATEFSTAGDNGTFEDHIITIPVDSIPSLDRLRIVIQTNIGDGTFGLYGVQMYFDDNPGICPTSLCGQGQEWVDVTGNQYWSSSSYGIPADLWDGEKWVMGSGEGRLTVINGWNADFRPEAIRFFGDALSNRSYPDRMYPDTLYVTTYYGGAIYGNSRARYDWGTSLGLSANSDLSSVLFNTYTGGEPYITKIEVLCPGSSDSISPYFTEISPVDGAYVNVLSLKIGVYDDDSGVDWDKTLVAEHTLTMTTATPTPVLGGSWSVVNDEETGKQLFYTPPESLSEGFYTFNVLAMDKQGNAASHELTVYLDTTPPEVSVTWNDGQNGPVFSPSVSLDGNNFGYVSIDSLVSLDSSFDYDTPAYSYGTFHLQLTDLNPGLNHLLLTVHDQAGNVTSLPIEIEYIIPVEQPVNVSPGAGVTVYNSVTPLLAASDYSNVNNTPQAASQWKIESDTLSYDSGVVAAATQYEVPLSAALVYGDNYRWRVRYQDENGVWSQWSEATQVLLVEDLVPPEVTLSSGSSVIVTNSSYTIQGTKEAQAELYMNGLLLDGFTDASEWSVDVTVSKGENSYSFTSQDAAGNICTPVNLSVILDTEPPVLTSAVPQGDSYVTAAESLVLVFTDAWSGLDYAALIASAEIKNSENQIVAGDWTVNEGEMLFTPLAPLSDGHYQVFVTPVDSLGNSRSIAYGFTVDQQVPVVSALAMSPDGPHQAEGVIFNVTFNEVMDTTIQPSFSFKVAEGGSFSIQGSSEAKLNADDFTGNLGNWLNNTTWQGRYRFTDAMGDGDYSITIADAQDLAGNSMAAQVVGTFVLDTVAPAQPTVSSTLPTATVAPTLPLNGIAEMGSQIVINGVVRATADASGLWSCLFALHEGTNDLTLLARDAAGNNSEPLTLTTVTLDTTAPAFSVTPYAAVSSSSSLNLSGTIEAGAVLRLDGVVIADQDGDGDSSTWSYALPLQGTGLLETYTLTASDALGNSVSKIIKVTYDAAAPGALAAGALQANGEGNGQQVKLSWLYDEPVDLAYYRIYQSQASISDLTGLTSIGTVNRGTKSLTVNGLTGATQYSFAVEPVDGSGNSIKTPVYSASATPVDIEAPEEITSLAATVAWLSAANNQVTLTWQGSVNSSGDLAQQKIYRDNGSGYDGGSVLGAAVTTYQDSGLADKQRIKYKITSLDAGGHESSGNIITVTTALDNPAGLTAQSGNNKIILTWQPVTSSELLKYKIYRASGASAVTNVTGMTLLASSDETEFVDNTAVNDTAYQYAVTAVNKFGAEKMLVSSVTGTPRTDSEGPTISGPSNAQTANLLGQGAVLIKPLTLIADATDAESAVTSMTLFIDSVPVASGTNSVSYFWNLIATTDGSHELLVRAVDGVGNSSDVRTSVQINLAAPSNDADSLKITTPADGALPLTDTIPVSGVAPQFTTVSLKVNDTLVATTEVGEAGTFSFSAVPLAAGTNTLQIMAAHRGGESGWSGPVKVVYDTGAPNAPETFAAKALSGGALQFTWAAGSGEVPSSYNLYSSEITFSTVAAATKVNSSPIPQLYHELIPADDGARFYAVTAVDVSGNESALSAVLEVASDRSSPALQAGPQFTISNAGVDGSAGPGLVNVSLTLSEALAESPFFSLNASSGSPIVIKLQPVDDTTTYEGSFQVNSLTPSGTTSYTCSAKDVVGNRSQLTGSAIVIDSKGPQGSIAGVPEMREADGSQSLTLSFDEAPDLAAGQPQLALVDSAGKTVSVSLSQTDSLTWSGSVELDDLAAGTAEFSLVQPVKDILGNSSSQIVAGAEVELYVGDPPAPGIPQALLAASRQGGEISLSWQGVSGAQKYRVYRRTFGDSEWPESIAETTSIYYDDVPAVDGDYQYAIAAVGSLGSESELSVVADATSDRLPPAVPVGLSLQLDGNGVKADWSAVAEASSYKLYRSAASITLVTATSEVSAIDPAPQSNPQGYVVTALDAVGNESAPSEVKELTFAIAPPASFSVRQSGSDLPELQWSGSGSGYYIYRNGKRINSEPVTVTSYTDIYYDGSEVVYAISVVDGAGHESPLREILLPEFTLKVSSEVAIKRGIIEQIPLIMTSQSSVTVDELVLTVGSLPESSLAGPFTVSAGSETVVKKVAVAGLDSQDSVAVKATAVILPAAGSRLEISRISAVKVKSSGAVLEVFNEPLIRGTQATIRFKLNNLGTSRMDVVTSSNGGSSKEIRVVLCDEDDNVLAQGSLNQRTGSQVVNSGSVATARIDAGATFTSDAIHFMVPEAAPYKVYLKAQVDAAYYHYGEDDQVIAPGVSRTIASTIADVSYTAQAQVDKVANSQGKKSFLQGEDVHITGTVVNTSDSSAAAYAPVRIGVSVSGFDRYFEVTSTVDGTFDYTFTPTANEVGHYTVWASHPDLSDRPVQDSFDIVALQLSPSRFDLKLGRQNAYEIPLTLKNLSDADLTEVAYTLQTSDGLSAEIIDGGSSVLAGGETRKLKLRVTATADCPNSGSVNLVMSVAEGLQQSLSVIVNCYDNIPIIATSPSYLETGLVRNSQQVKSFTVTNNGLATLDNAIVGAPSLPWLRLAVNAELGDLAVGQSAEVALLIQPDEAVAPGTYLDQVVIRSDNHIPFSYNIKVTVTSDAVGSVLFDVLDELNEDVAGGTITLQSQQFPELVYLLKTDSVGTVLKTDLPEGRYSYTVTAPGHRSYSSSLTIVPGLQITVPVALEVTLVEVEWSVKEITIEDRYEILVKQTFETSVPTAVIVVEPALSNLPVLQPGEVYNGEFTITNYGLIKATFTGLTFPDTFDEYEVEVFDTVPDELKAMQRVVVPYRITRKAE